MAGAPHHTVLTKALPRGALEDLATIVGVELVAIDGDTTIASVTRELRWNAAYYRLARRALTWCTPARPGRGNGLTRDCVPQVRRRCRVPEGLI